MVSTNTGSRVRRSSRRRSIPRCSRSLGRDGCGRSRPAPSSRAAGASPAAGTATSAVPRRDAPGRRSCRLRSPYESADASDAGTHRPLRSGCEPEPRETGKDAMPPPFARPSEPRWRVSSDLRSEQEYFCRSPRFRGISLALAFSQAGFPAGHREGDRIEAEVVQRRFLSGGGRADTASESHSRAPGVADQFSLFCRT